MSWKWFEYSELEMKTMGTISLAMIRFYPVCWRRDFNRLPPRILRQLCVTFWMWEGWAVCVAIWKMNFFSLSSSRTENFNQLSWCEFLICCKPFGHRRKNKESDGKCERKMVGGVLLFILKWMTYKITDSRLDCWTWCSTHVTCDGIVFASPFVCVCVCVCADAKLFWHCCCCW